MDSNQDNFSCSFVSSQSQHLFTQKHHALLGISPFNSYFSEKNISLWLQWALKNFASFHIFVPDTLPIYTFLALGYSESKAIQKAKRQACYLKNKIYRALSKNHIVMEQLLIDMSVLEKNNQYLHIKEKCNELYLTNIQFKDQCDLSTGWVINGQKIKDETRANKNIAVEYILAEMPLFIDTPAILNTPSSLFVYHQTPQIINYLHANHIKNKFISENQGFIELAFEENEANKKNGVFIDDGVQRA